MRLLSLSIILLLLGGISPARAEWLEASSAHFVVYADDTERDLRRYSDQLERYHAAMAFLTGRNTTKPSPSNRVTVYLVRSERAVQDLYGKGSKFVGGFYVPRAGGSVAISPRVSVGVGEDDFSRVALLHEYAHHFMISASAMPLPRWASEGGAEFFSASKFEKDGGITVGRAAQHRAAELYLARDVSAADLLDPAEYAKHAGKSYDAFYGKSWLLYHYLTFDEARKGQLRAYYAALEKGTVMREAAVQAFGDFTLLEKDLDRYLGRSKISALGLPASLLQVGPVEVRRLRPGEAAIMPVVIRSQRGVDDAQAKAVLTDARAIAVRFPGDPAVLCALAEAEFDAGNDKAAIAAADAAIAIDPGQTRAYLQKGYALFHTAQNETDKPAAYKRARAPFIALNARESDHPIPLIYYYLSFTMQGREPPPLAIEGLIRAVEVAPFDLGLRMTLATALIRTGRQGEARKAMGPVAFNPHGGGLAEAARRVLAKLDTEPGWKGSDINKVIGPASEAKASSPFDAPPDLSR
jgi:tetratricopeptide (TPR) repeat protein